MINTNSAFFYGLEVNQFNNVLTFNEGGADILAFLNVGKYTLTSLLSECLRAMNDLGALTYTGSIDRQQRSYTITGSGVFSLLVASGSTDASVFELINFTGTDRVGSSSYTSSAGIGQSYLPQFRLQSFVDFDHNQKAVDSTLNVSASGRIELIRFGVVKFMECDIQFITNIDQGFGAFVRTDLTGLAKALSFMQYATTKGPMEFLPDVLNPSSFRTCVLDSTPESKDGVDFKMKEQYARGLPGYYSTGLLTFREVTL